MDENSKNRSTHHTKSRSMRSMGAATLSGAMLFSMLAISTAPSAFAAEAPVDLGSAGTYSVLAGQTVTNTGSTTIAGDLGTSPGTAITGFPPGLISGETHLADGPALLAQSDLAAAYDNAASRQPMEILDADLSGRTLVSGVYARNTELGITGNVTLDGQGDPNSVWIFQVGSALNTSTDSSINLINGANACNIYWQVGSSATLGTGSDFKGSIMALTSVSVNTDSTVEGRVLARNGSVTLDNNVFVEPNCDSSIPDEGETPTPDPTDPPVETPEPPVEPTDPPVAPVEPEPTDPPVVSPEPTDPPVESPEPTEPTEPPVEPTEPTEPPVEPTEPTEPPVESPEPSEEPVNAPTDETPLEPTPVDNGTITPNNENPTPTLDYSEEYLTPSIDAGDTVNAEIVSTDGTGTTDELAQTGAKTTTLYSSLAALLLFAGGALVLFSSKFSRTARQQ